MASRKLASPASPKSDPGFSCEFCKRSFSREKTLFVHACEQKLRWMNRDDKHVKVAYMVYKKFYDMSIRDKKIRTYEDFMKSPYYTAFVKFGRYMMDIQAINPEQFVEFLIKTTVALDRWHVPFIYEQYVRELNKKETAMNAVERNILLMQQWSMDSGEPWNDFFKKVNPNVATQWIRSGRLSPWVLYTANTATDLFERFTDEQVSLIENYVNPMFWQRKLADNPKDVAFIKQLMSEAHL